MKKHNMFSHFVSLLGTHPFYATYMNCSPREKYCDIDILNQLQMKNKVPPLESINIKRGKRCANNILLTRYKNFVITFNEKKKKKKYLKENIKGVNNKIYYENNFPKKNQVLQKRYNYFLSPQIVKCDGKDNYKYVNNKGEDGGFFVNNKSYKNVKSKKITLGKEKKDHVNQGELGHPDSLCSENVNDHLNSETELCNDTPSGGEKKAELTEDAFNFIESIIKKHKIVLFMKGTALNPFCKYSKQAIHILKLNKVKEIRTVNVLENEQLRSSLKNYSQWPTFPQLYVNGNFVGGIDKLQELHDNKKLKDILEH
ncbi:glutaredoxin-like protein [Plasmodium gonderi]|uniref:Glutaredoxin-like protein n=1 Tax=Plasmodium gonderi TaxID=77519 RepID=A0A1Y1JB63_PLAGO|nr:glutaredoxin-like protein [Plasmodium gonderi]GAW78928.1 glutaredoxin-like protein [Plasmodium gonderi]